MKSNLNLQTGRRHSSINLPPLSTTRTPASNPMATRFRRPLGQAPLALLALLALALTAPVREASAQGPPTATTLDATGVFDGGATLNGYFDPNGDPMALAWFEWSGGSTRPFTGGGYVSAEVGMAHGPPLTAGTTYYFQLVAANQWGTAYGGEMSFTTPGGVYPPTLVTLPATEVTSSSATLNGSANPNGWGDLVWFEWGTSTGYGNSTPWTDIGTGTSAVPLSAPLASLIPSTTYHFRVHAAHGMIEFYGGDQSFTTLPSVGPPEFSFTTNADNTITITGHYGPVAVTIPGTITGLPVTSIGERAFAEYYSLTSVTIPDSVTNIGDSAFSYCFSLTNVTIPDSVIVIGDEAFWRCGSLTSVAIGNSVTSIGEEAFSYCTSLTSVTLPHSVTNIGNSAFLYCTNLTSITIPNSVTSIGDFAFSYCTSLTSITIPDSVTRLGREACQYCTSLANVTIGNGVTSIGEEAFYYCASLTKVTIAKSVSNIGSDAFGGCTGLTSVTIGSSVTSIEDSAFWDCTSLTSITIPNSVTGIGRYAFQWCTGLTSVTIGSSVTSIGDYTFHYCPNLRGVFFLGNVPSLGGTNVFQKDTNATVYYLPWTTGWGTTFGGRPTAVWQSPPPSAWTLSASIITPTGATLNGTINPNGWPTTAWFQWGATTDYGQLTPATGIGSGTSASPLSAPLAGLTPGVTYHYRAAASNSNGAVYGSDQSFTPSDWTGEFTVTNGTVTIAGYTGAGGAVTIPSTINGLPVTGIGDRAFYQCTCLTSITVPDSVTTIGNASFQYCSRLTNATIGNGVTSIGDAAFVECSTLINVTIGNGVTSIGDYAFYFCSSLTALRFGGNAPSLDPGVFEGDFNTTIYYLPGTTGWGTTFGGLPTALWFLPNPLILTSGPGFGMQSNAFGFIISWATNTSVVVEACTNPANHSWSPLQTNALTGGLSYFSDPQWANYPARFYRLRQP